MFFEIDMPNTMDKKDVSEKSVTPKKLVDQGVLFDIGKCLRSKKGEQFFVCDREGSHRFELKLNSTGDICFLDGRNLRLLDRSCGDFYLEGESVEKMIAFENEEREQKPVVQAPAARNPEVCGFNNEVFEAVKAIVGGKGRPAPPEQKENADLSRLTKVLDIILPIDRKYMVFSRFRNGQSGVTIRFINQNGAEGKAADLKALGCEVCVSACFIDVNVDCSKEEEKVARNVGHKFTVIY